MPFEKVLVGEALRLPSGSLGSRVLETTFAPEQHGHRPESEVNGRPMQPKSDVASGATDRAPVDDHEDAPQGDAQPNTLPADETEDNDDGALEDARSHGPTSKLPPWLTQPMAYRVAGLAVVALVLFSMLSKSGIWDPYELDAADLARRIAVRVFGAAGLELPGGVNALPTLTDLKMGELPFTSMALAFKLFGLHDWTGRLALALWGFAGALVLYEFMARLVHPRAGLYSVIALVTMPLYFIQARSMLGDIVTMAAFAMAFCGLTGALIEGDDRGPVPADASDDTDGLPVASLAWFAVGLVGLAAGYYSRGALIGVALPALAVGLAWLAMHGAGLRSFAKASLSDSFGALALVAGLVELGIGLRALGRAAPEGTLLRALGFVVQRHAPTDATFDLVVRQLGHALFPWSAFLPVALGRLMRVPAEAPEQERTRYASVRVALLVGAGVAYGVFAMLAPVSGLLPFSAPALLAAVAAIAIFDVERGAPPSRAAALACLMFGVVLYADLVREPEKALAAFVVDRPQFPKTFEASSQSMMRVTLAAFCGLTGLAWLETQPRLKRHTLASLIDDVVSWLRDVGDSYRRGFHDLLGIWNGNLFFVMVVLEAALCGLGDDLRRSQGCVAGGGKGPLSRRLSACLVGARACRRLRLWPVADSSRRLS